MSAPRHFRKKPIVVKAMQFEGTVHSADAITAWAGVEPNPELPGCWRDRIDRPTQFGPLRVRTLEGDMLAAEGDWVIMGVKGEFYPCKPDIFEATYEPAD